MFHVLEHAVVHHHLVQMRIAVLCHDSQVIEPCGNVVVLSQLGKTLAKDVFTMATSAFTLHLLEACEAHNPLGLRCLLLVLSCLCGKAGECDGSGLDEK